MGIEVVRAKDNMQYSRSLMFNYGIPFWNQGLNISYSVMPGRLSTTLYVVNASDGRISAEANKSPALGANLNFVPFEGLSANYNYIGGIESSASNSRRDVHEVNAVYTFSPSVTVAADYTIGSEQNTVPVVGGASQGAATWSGAAIYVKAALTDWYTLSPRFEIFDDEKGWALGGLASKASLADVVPGQKINSITVSNIFELGDGFETRLEYRTDKSDRSVYYKDENGALTDRQDTYTVALLYSF